MSDFDSMGLMQIAEPGMSAAPHEERLAVGIDLGTTNSLVASVINGAAEVIPDEKGRALFPSVVRFLADGTVETGWDALAQQAEDPLNTVSSAKRLIGRGLKDIAGNVTMPYRFVEGDGMVRLVTASGVKSPVEVSAEVLKALRTRAQARLGGELVGAVITVPAYFDDAQRQATKDAAKLAGLNVLRLLNEPTAAALAYGLDNGAEGLYLIYDLGGGTFDVSLLELTKGVFEVLATGGNSALGGDDFDHRVVCWALEGFASDGSVLCAQDKRRLTQAAKAAREALTEAQESCIELTLADGREIKKVLTRCAFNEMVCPLVKKTTDAVSQVLNDASKTVADIKGVVLVGGSTRMPCVREAAAAYFGKTPLCDIDPDKVVALGASMQANKLAGNSAAGDDWLLLDVTPLSLGLETMGGLVEKVIPRNTAIPTAMAQDFTTFKDGQTAMAIHVVQGEREVVDACRSLARFELRGIPPMAAGAARIRVTFQIDADGLLSVSARELGTGVESSVRVKPSYGLTDEDIIGMLKDGTAAAKSDMAERELRENRVEADRLIESTNSALAEDADLLSAEERAAIEAAKSALKEAAAGSDAAVIKKELDNLTKATGEFAARRMDRSIRRALAGQDINTL